MFQSTAWLDPVLHVPLRPGGDARLGVLAGSRDGRDLLLILPAGDLQPTLVHRDVQLVLSGMGNIGYYLGKGERP